MSCPGQRVVLITGAAGGLGSALITAFAEAGWAVAAGWHREPLSASVPEFLPLPLDVTCRAASDAAVTACLHRWNRLDALINNAGASVDDLVVRLDPADWDRLLEVNLKGAFLCAQAALPPMLRQRDGHIVNVASFAALGGAAGQSAYAAAKAGLLGLTRSLAREVGVDNVRVNAVLPGVLPTGMTASLNREQLAGFTADNALGRLNDPAEVARFIAFLTTLNHVSGQTFNLDSRIARTF